MRKALAILTCIGFILGTTHLALSAPPAIDLADYGVALWNSPSGDDLDFWVRVIDHDGNIDNNGDTGAPHQVTVNFPTVSSPNFPNGIGSIILPRLRVENSTTSVYWNALRLGEGYTLPGGNYVFRATDSMGNVGEATDAFTPIPLNPVADSSLSPSNRNQYISAMFDNVFVKRDSQSNWTLYDDFSSGSFDFIDRWTHPSGSVYYAGTVTAETAILPVPNPIGRGRSQLRFKNQPDTISGIRADITLSSASSTVPKARIGGYFFKNQNAHIFTEIAVYENRIVCTASEDWNLNGVWWTGAVLFQQEWTNEFGFIGETVRALIEWDGFTLKFAADVGASGTQMHSVEYSLADMLPPTDHTKYIESVINLVTSNDSPTISWAAAPGASRYRVSIYPIGGGSAIWNFFPEIGQTSFRIPPGILRATAEYEYQVISLNNHIPGDADNFGTTGTRVRFRTGPASTVPYIIFDSTGVQVWNTEENGSYLTYWIKVYDAQGVPGNIKSVKVHHPNDSPGDEAQLFYDSKSSGSSTTSGVYRTDDYKRPPVNGTYIFTVEDLEGHTYSVSEDLIANPLPVPANLTINGQPAHGALLNTTAADFTWNPVSGTAFYRVELYDQTLTRTHALATQTNSLSLPAGYLKEGTVYGARVTARREFFDENVDNGSTSHLEYMLANFRTTGINGNASNVPSISLEGGLGSIRKGAYVWTFPKYVNGTTVPAYWLSFEARVSDVDGVPGNIKSVKVRYPDGNKELVLRYDSKIDNYSASYWNREAYSSYAEIPTGTYTFIVEDFDAHQIQITEYLAFAAPLGVPENIWPGKGDVVIEPTPVIDWDEVPGAAAYRVRLYRGWSNLVHESPVLLTNYYEIPLEYSLVGGESYSLRVYAFAEDPATGDVDSQSSSTIFFAEKPQFTVELQQDPDGDGIYGAIDSAPIYSNNFTETGTGPTYGSIITRGEQVLKIYNRAGVEGVFIETDAGVVGVPAQIDVCGGLAILEINEGAHMRVICGSVKINVLKGAVTAEFKANGEVVAVSTITQESSGLVLTFEPTTATFTTAPILVTTEEDPLPTAPVQLTVGGSEGPEFTVDQGDTFAIDDGEARKIVRVDIKPGSANNTFNPKGGGVLPVAIFGERRFDVTKIDLAKLTLEGMNVKMLGKKSPDYQVKFSDVDNDGILDITVHFEDMGGTTILGSDYAVLTGEIVDGFKFQGKDKLTITPLTN